MDTLPHNGAVITLLAVTGSDTPADLQGHLRHDPHHAVVGGVVIGLLDYGIVLVRQPMKPNARLPRSDWQGEGPWHNKNP